MQRTRDGPQGEIGAAGPAQGVLGLFALIAAGAALGGLLWRLAGPPDIPSGLPTWQEVSDALAGSSLAYEDVAKVAGAVGWLALAYLSITVALRTLCEIAAQAADGAVWGRAALRFSDLITLPPVRRIVDGSLAGVLLVAAWLRTGPLVAAEGPVVAAVSAAEPREYVGADVGGLPTWERANGHFDAPKSGSDIVSYTVVEGDTLWSIARRFYGDGSLYTSIFEADAGRTMASGEAFTDPSLIRPGWVLEIPMPGQHAWPEGEHMMYRVREGDSLWRIAEGLLGGGLRWTEIWDLNKGRDMGGGQGFVNPGRIFSGWVLELPVAASPSKTEPTAGPTEAPTPGPSPEPTAVAPTEQPRSPVSPRPTTFPLPGSPDGGNGALEWPAPLGGTVLAAAVGLGATGGVALIVRGFRRRSGSTAAAVIRHKHSTGDAGRVDLAARSLLSALRELGFEDVRLLLVRESERFLEFALDCAPGDADALVRSRFDIGRRLACAADAEAVSATRIHLKLSRFQRLAAMLIDRATAPPVVLLVPAGAAQNGIHYLNLAAAGSVLLTGSELETSQMTSSWLSTLSTLRPPEQLAFLVGGPGQEDMIERVRQFAGPRDTGRRSIQQLAGELEEAIVSRESSAEMGARPLIVSCAALSEEGMGGLSRLETVVHRGPEHGIYTVCVTQHPVEITNMFGARVTLGSGEVEPDELTLTIGRDAPIVLKPVEVRAQPLRRHGEPPEWVAAEAVAPIDAPGEIVDPDEPAIEPTDVSEDGPLDEGPPPSADPVAMADLPVPIRGSGPLDSGAAGQGSRQAALLVADEAEPVIETGSASHPTFEVKCFGSFQVLTGDQEVTGWTIQKARELLAYLIARGGTRVPRGEAAEALWPEEAADQVEHLLSNAAYYVRKTLKTANPSPNGRLLTISEQRYQLLSGVFRVDLDAFDAHLRRAETLQGADALIEYDRALAIYKGDFLGNEPYEWADAYRRDYQRRFIAAAHQAGRLALECRDVKKAVAFYQAILDRDPIDEEAVRALMRCYAKVSDTNAVRKVYKVLRESLRRELEDEKAEPLPATTALVQELTQ